LLLLLCFGSPGFFADVGKAECTGCPKGTYVRMDDDFCSSCERGYWCPGKQDKVACPYGTWMNGSGASMRSLCLRCTKPEACLPGGECASGYEGSFCLDCWTRRSLGSDGLPWYKHSDSCYPCPTNTTMMMALAGGGFFLFAVIILCCMILSVVC
jgi:hypothetical protein